MEEIVQDQGSGNYQERHQIIKPERPHAQHDISDCTASNGRNEPYDEQPEQVKLLCRRQPDTADGKRECAYYLNPIHTAKLANSTKGDSPLLYHFVRFALLFIFASNKIFYQPI